MSKKRKLLLLALISFYLIHLTRDILQDLNIDIFLANMMVKVDKSNTPVWYWQIFNTYLIELVGFCCAVVSLINNRFKPFGFLSVVIFVLFLIIWLFYWLFL